MPRDVLRILLGRQFAVFQCLRLRRSTDWASGAGLTDACLQTWPVVVLAKGELQSSLTWMAKMVMIPFGCVWLDRLGDADLAVLSQ